MMTTDPARREGQPRGYAMAVLLVTLAIMGVALGVAVPVWHNVVQRDREEELIFRGRQYARAVGLFQRRFANTYPPSFDVLVEQKFLRKKYADPMTASGEFVVLYQGSAFSLPGGSGSSSPGAGRQTGGSSSPFGAGISASTIGGQRGQSTAFGTAGRGVAGPRGGVIGVVSESEEKSIKILDGRSQYSEWRFVWLPTTTPGRGGGANQPGGGRGDPGGIGLGQGRGLGRGQGRGPGGGRGEGRGGQLGNPGQGRGGQPGLPGGGRQSGRGRSG